MQHGTHAIVLLLLLRAEYKHFKRQGDVVCAMTLEALMGTVRPFHPAVHMVRVLDSTPLPPPAASWVGGYPHRPFLIFAVTLPAMPFRCSSVAPYPLLTLSPLRNAKIHIEIQTCPPFPPPSHPVPIGKARRHSGQQLSALRIRSLLHCEAHPSQISQSHVNCGVVQDAYTLRCAPQVVCRACWMCGLTHLPAADRCMVLFMIPWSSCITSS